MKLQKKSLLIYTITILINLTIANAIHGNYSKQHAISFKVVERDGFGDHITTYMNTKLLSYKYNIPFYTIPFRYSQVLSLNKVNSYLDENIKKQFEQVIEIKSECDLVKHLRTTNKSTLFINNLGVHLDVFAPLVANIQWPDQYDNLNIYTIGNPSLKKAINIEAPINELVIPNNVITVAVHIRKPQAIDPEMACQSLDEFEKNIQNNVKKTHNNYA